MIQILGGYKPVGYQKCFVTEICFQKSRKYFSSMPEILLKKSISIHKRYFEISDKDLSVSRYFQDSLKSQMELNFSKAGKKHFMFVDFFDRQLT